MDECLSGYRRHQRLADATLCDYAGGQEELCHGRVERCPRCHTRRHISKGSDGSTQVVTLLSVSVAVNVTIPILHCFLCKENCHASPLALGFFPAITKKVLNLTTAKQIPIWFHIDFLRLLSSLQVCRETLPATLGALVALAMTWEDFSAFSGQSWLRGL